MKKYSIEIKWAIIFAAMFLLWITVEKLAGLHGKHIAQQQLVNMFVLIPSVIVYVLAIKDKKKNDYAGTITYKQSFISGLILTVFIVVLSPINQLIASYVISPEFFANAIAHTVKSGMFTQKQAEAQFNNTNYIITSIIGGLVTGIFFSAIISIFTRTKNK